MLPLVVHVAIWHAAIIGKLTKFMTICKKISVIPLTVIMDYQVQIDMVILNIYTRLLLFKNEYLKIENEKYNFKQYTHNNNDSIHDLKSSSIL